MDKTNENIVTLIKPIKRGEQVITGVTLLKPCAGTLRGVSGICRKLWRRCAD